MIKNLKVVHSQGGTGERPPPPHKKESRTQTPVCRFLCHAISNADKKRAALISATYVDFGGPQYRWLGMVDVPGESFENEYCHESNDTKLNSRGVDGIELGVVSTNDLSNVARELTVFPNPSNGQFALNLEGFTGAVTVDVYNIVGRKVWTSNVNAGAGVQQVDLTSLDAGNYLISASDDAQTLTRRLTILD